MISKEYNYNNKFILNYLIDNEDYFKVYCKINNCTQFCVNEDFFFKNNYEIHFLGKNKLGIITNIKELNKYYGVKEIALYIYETLKFPESIEEAINYHKLMLL